MFRSVYNTVVSYIRQLSFCVAQRGVEDSSSYTVTSKLGGNFKTDSDLRKEFMDLVK